MTADDRFDKYETFRAEAAAKLQLPIDNDRVRLLAALKLNHESLLERMIRGDNVSPDHVETLTAAIERMLPPEVPQLIKFQYVSGVTGIYTCQHCHKQNEIPEGDYTPAGSKPEMLEITQPEAGGEPGVSLAEAMRAVKAAQPVEATPDTKLNAPQVAATSASATPKPAEVPYHERMLKRDPVSNDWKRHVAADTSNPYGVGGESNPLRSNGHALPGANGGLCWFGTAK